MKRKKLFGILLGICILVTACASSKNFQMDMAKGDNASAPQEAESSQLSGSMADNGSMKEESLAVTEEGFDSSSGSSSNSVKNTSQKLIKNVYMDLETKEFNDLLDKLYKKVSELNGYVENSEVSGSSYDYDRSRYASLTIRVPSKSLDQFVTVVEKDANVTNKSENVQDVTLQYVDLSSHIAALRAEQESLMKLLKEATKMDDIIQIQSQLTQVRYEIESYESQLRTYDNLVDYSTVNLNISEVKRETVMETKSFGEKATARFNTSIYDIGQGFLAFSIWLIGSSPYLLIGGVVLVLFVLVLRKTVPQRRRKKFENFQAPPIAKEENKKDL